MLVLGQSVFTNIHALIHFTYSDPRHLNSRSAI